MGGGGAPNNTRARDNATSGNKCETIKSGHDKNLRADMFSEKTQDFYSDAVQNQFTLSGQEGVHMGIGQLEKWQLERERMRDKINHKTKKQPYLV